MAKKQQQVKMPMTNKQMTQAMKSTGSIMASVKTKKK